MVWTSVYRCFPDTWRQAVERTDARLLARVQEIRLRCGAPLTLTTADGNTALGVTVSEDLLRDCFWRLCGQAVHAHETELAQGFITTADGFRVGVAGTAVLKNGCVTAYRNITSLCIRLPRAVYGAAAPLLPYVDTPRGIRSLLVCGPPASGKTTVLRDLAQSLSATRHVAVVDERSELSLGGLPRCDVLKACPKSVGILQAIRTLSPQAVIADELGGEKEWEAVCCSCFCGVSVIASVHALSVQDLLARDAVREALKNGAFSRIALLPPREDARGETRLWKVREWIENGGGFVGCVRLRGDGDCGIGGAAATGEAVGSVDGASTAITARAAVFHATV